MTKEEIAGVLEKIATLLELKNENPFKIRAYANAARAIETFGGNIANFQDEEALAKIPGIGKSIAEKIKELAATGSLKYFEELSAEFPPGIMELFSLSGLGAKKIKSPYDQLRISSIEQSLNYLALGRPRSKSSATRSRNAHRMPVRFSSGKSLLKRKRCVLIWRRTATLRRSISPGAIGAERRFCTISICWSPQKIRQRSCNPSFRIRWSNRPSRTGRRNRACGFAPECSVICAL